MSETAAAKLLAALAEAGGRATTRALAQRAAINSGYAREVLFGLMTAGKVTRERAATGRSFIWKLASDR